MFRAPLPIVFGLAVFLLTACSRSPRYYFDRGNKLSADGRLAEAELQYRKAIQGKPDFGEAWYRLGLTQAREGDGNDGLASLSRAVELLPSSDEAKISLADLSVTLYLATPARPKVLYDRISTFSDDLLKRNPKSFDGLRLKGSLALSDMKPEIAIEDFRKANDIRPGQPPILMGLAEGMFQLDQFDQAEKLALEVIQKHPEFAPTYDVLYVAYMKKRRVAEAEHIAELKVANNPKRSQYVVELARHYARQNKTGEMERSVGRLLDQPRDFPNGALEAGDFYFSIGKADQALRCYRQGKGVTYQKRIASLMIAQGRLDEAAKLVDTILSADPKDPDSQAIRADLWIRSGRTEKVAEAAGAFEALVKAKPADPNLRFGLGRALAAKGELDRARREILEALKESRQFVSAWLELAELDFRLEKYGEALEILDRLTAREPGNLPGRLLRADCLRVARRYGESRRELAGILRERPGNRQALVGLGSLLIAEHKFNEAVKIFEPLRQSDPKDTRVVIGLAEVYSSQAKFDRSLDLLSQHLLSVPNTRDVQYALATTAIRAGKYGTAIEQLKSLLVSEPANVALALRLGDVYRLNNEPDKAISAYKKAQEVASDNLQPTFSLALALDAAGRFDEAKAGYARVISGEPKNAWALNKLAFLLAENGGSLDEALGLAQRAIRESGLDPNISDTVGWIYFKKKMYAEAARVFDQLVTKYPDTPMFRYHRGALLLETGDKKQARKELNLALTLGLNARDQEKTKQLLARIG